MTVTDRRQSGLLQMVQQNDEKHDEQHQRLRDEVRKLEARLDTLARSDAAHTLDIDRLDKRPTDVSKLLFTPQLVVAIVTIAMSIAGGMYASTYGLRSDVRDILTRADAQAKIQDERASTLRNSIDEMKRRVELQQFQIGELRDMIVKQQGGKK